MATHYRVYGNGGSGGPVDYTTVLQDSASLSFSYATIPPGDWTFSVRAYDTVSGLSEQNTDATVRVIIGSDYLDHTSIPNSPFGLTVTPMAGGQAKLDFTYIAKDQAGPPTSFNAWLWSGAVDWTLTPTLTQPVVLSRSEVFRHVTLTLSGLVNGVSYTVGVRAVNSAGNDGNTVTLTVVGKSVGPGSVGGLTAVASYPTGE